MGVGEERNGKEAACNRSGARKACKASLVEKLSREAKKRGSNNKFQAGR
jgi:hypothetical protein